MNSSKFANYKAKYIGVYEKQFNEKIDRISKKLNDIRLKIEKDLVVSQSELDMICGFVSVYRENSLMLGMVVKYIFNNLTRQSNQLKCSSYVLYAILTYIPYTCGELMKNGFNPRNVRMFASNILSKQVETIRNGKRILNQVLGNHSYDDLIDSNRRLTVEYYNRVVENINNSENLKENGNRRK